MSSISKNCSEKTSKTPTNRNTIAITNTNNCSPLRNKNNDQSLSLSNNSYPIFDPLVHLNKECPIHFIQTNKLNNCYNTAKNLSHLEKFSNSFCLFTESCIEVINWELTTYYKKQSKKKVNSCSASNGKKSGNCCGKFESPLLKDCEHKMPFTYSALSHDDTLTKLSDAAGFQLMISKDYEIAHFMSPNFKHTTHSLTNNNIKNENNHVAKLNLIKQKKIIQRKKSIAYPYILLINLDSNSISGGTSFLPPGYAILLSGRLIENLSNEQNKFVLCPTYQPRDILSFEDEIFQKRQLLKMTSTLSQTDDHPTTTVSSVVTAAATTRLPDNFKSFKSMRNSLIKCCSEEDAEYKFKTKTKLIEPSSESPRSPKLIGTITNEEVNRMAIKNPEFKRYKSLLDDLYDGKDVDLIE